MPGIGAHMALTEYVRKNANITNNDFIRGNLLPDLLKTRKKDNHYKEQKKNFLVPNPDKYKKENDISNYLNLGYYTHLVLDKYYLEEYIPKYIKKDNLFDDKDIYIDYDNINYYLVKRFNIDVDKYISILKYPDFDIDKNKLKTNINCLMRKEEKETKYIDKVLFGDFIEEVGNKIIEEIKI